MNIIDYKTGAPKNLNIKNNNFHDYAPIKEAFKLPSAIFGNLKICFQKYGRPLLERF
jgi:hypothetical protein